MRRQFDLLEVGLAAGFCLLLGVLAGLHYYERLNPLRAYEARYGAKVSLNGEEWLIRDFFGDRRDGVFVDVGANHYRDGSNTYYLELAQGWSGMAIDPQPEFAADYARHRPRTTYVQAFVSDKVGTIPFFVPISGERHRGVASADKVFVEAAAGPATQHEVPTVTLDALLERAGIGRVDFVTMDIERHEPYALAGFSVQRYRPALVCVEAHEPIRQQLLDYFARRGYVMVGKYSRVDTVNYWFQPLDDHGNTRNGENAEPALDEAPRAANAGAAIR